ncbi:MAG: hypothetical protein KDI03_18595 [Anaerolineae bacterium]|nr:hypothetical protein [Anaerolineae bacterium]
MQQFKRLLFSIVIAALLLGGHVRLVTAQERPPTTCGVTTWSQNIAVNAQPRTVITDLLLDSNDNAIVNGYTIRNDASIVKWFTRKYDASGLQVWEYQHPDAGRTVLPANVTTESVALDNDENVYVLRLVAGEKSTYAQLTRLAADDGALEWILDLEKIGGDESTYFNGTRHFIVQEGTVYIYGLLVTLAETPTSVLAIIRVSLNGELEAVHQLPLYHWSIAPSSKTWAVDSLGNSVVAGLIPSQYGSQGLTIIKFDADHELLWERDVPEDILGTNNGEDAIELKIDSRNYIHVIVPFDRQDPDLGRINGRTLLNYDPDGNLVWHQDLQYMGAAIYQPQHMEIGLNDDLFVFDKPYDRGDGAPSPIHLLRYDKDGSFLNFVEMPEIPGVALGLKTSPSGELTVWYGREVIENLVKTYTVTSHISLCGGEKS